MTFFLVITCFYDFLVALRMSQITPRLSCSLTSNFRHKNILTTFFTILPKLHFFLSKNSDDLFFSHHPFFTIFCRSVFSYFTHDESYSYFLHTIHPLYTHPHAVFTFLHLALCSRNSSYCIHHLFLLNSSLHKQPFITAHFRSSLHILCITAH